jgi:hypothetical protein
MSVTNIINRDTFMEFFRSEEGYSQLSADDCMELFSYSLKGSSDFTEELLKNIFADYGVSMSVSLGVRE